MPALPPYVLPLLYGLGSLFVALMGRHRKWGFWGYFWASLLMSPVLGLLFVLAVDKPVRKLKKPAVPTPAPAATPAPTTKP
jgi:peptidoglycan/LPS O-acetylase OafA/YrhL